MDKKEYKAKLQRLIEQYSDELLTTNEPLANVLLRFAGDHVMILRGKN
jgi:hypothetical protein